MKRKWFLAFAVVAVLALGWGYWHQLTHASLHVSLYDVALKTDRQAYGEVRNASIEFADASGAVLARGEVREPYGVFAPLHPEVGDCRRKESEATRSSESRLAWQQCFEVVSRWLPKWVRKTTQATVVTSQCRVANIPVTLHESGDSWWIWWVPLPHIGGKPYTYFDLTLKIDGARCRSVGDAAGLLR